MEENTYTHNWHVLFCSVRFIEENICNCSVHVLIRLYKGRLNEGRNEKFIYAESGAYFNNKPSAPRTRMKCL